MNSIKYIVLIIGLLLVASCSDFLDEPAQGVLSEGQVNTDPDPLVIAAYSWLGNDHYTAPNFLWTTGNLRAGDAHKGGNGPGDIFIYHALNVYNLIIADMSSYPPDFTDHNDNKWTRMYTGINRCNAALRVLNEVNAAEYPLKEIRTGEMRLIRGHFYFDLKIHHKFIPYFDETVEDVTTISNVDLTDQDLWDKIAEDFRFAYNNLPESQPEAGRFNKWSAGAYLAKALLYQAYEQNDQNQVTNINSAKLQEVVDIVTAIENSGAFSLTNDYAENFLHEFENNREAVFSIQRSIDDGSPDGRGSWSSALNYPQDPAWGCCGFHVPTHSFVNSFKTGSDGLPLFDSFDDANYEVAIDAVDPRLDHTVVSQGKPFKYDASFTHAGDAWARAPGIYGNFVAQKDLEHPDCVCRAANGPFTITSMNTPVIRYADVLLWKAEALIELNQLGEALTIINQIRERAANSTGRLNNASIYNIGSYAGFASQDEAREALRFERKLELGLEGHRFFDLVRWGIAKETLDAYLAVESTREQYLLEANFVQGRDEFMPIPQGQINLSGGLYQQNPGY